VPSEGEATPPARGRKRAVAALTLMVVAAVVVVTIVAARGGGHKTAGPPRTAAGAATVERRNLVTSEEETGKISYANSSMVANRLLGTLTWVPSVGRVIAAGQRLFDVDNFPVILMNGMTPAYRTLGATDLAGPDVQQLNDNLIHLGFDASEIVDDDEWQPATTAGVELLQQANGEPETGSLALGTVVFLRGVQRVASLDGGATSASDNTVEGHDEFVDATVTTPTLGTATTPPTATTKTTSTSPAPKTPHQSDGALTRAVSRLSTKIGQLQRQSQRLQHALAAAKSHAPSKRPSDSGGTGPVSGGDSPVMTTTSTNLVVTVNVSAGEQGVTHVGARVPVVMPSGATVHGRVTRIGQAMSAGGSGGSMVPITIHLDKHENGRNLDQATVSVTFVEKTARHVLSVPITALVAQPGGGYAVQRAEAPYALIDVTLGTFATGYVQVSGRGLQPGLTITDSQG
jgi:peptidoglycan hydrolase-like protein with peptidoglycan-binding domain